MSDENNVDQSKLNDEFVAQACLECDSDSCHGCAFDGAIYMIYPL